MGRPKGALNRRTRQFREMYEREGFTDPLIFLGRLVSKDTAELARALKMKRKDVLPVQVNAAKALAPYLHSQMPRAVKLEGEAMPMLVVGRIEPGSSEAKTIEAEGFSIVTAPAEGQPEPVEPVPGLPKLPELESGEKSDG